MFAGNCRTVEETIRTRRQIKMLSSIIIYRYHTKQKNAHSMKATGDNV